MFGPIKRLLRRFRQKRSLIYRLQVWDSQKRRYKTIFEAGEFLSKAKAMVYFEPGKKYRLMSQSLKDGKIMTEWTHKEAF